MDCGPIQLQYQQQQLRHQNQQNQFTYPNSPHPPGSSHSTCGPTDSTFGFGSVATSTTMNHDDQSANGTESMMAAAVPWATPVSRPTRQRPATIHEGFSYCASGDFGGSGGGALPGWDAVSLSLHHTPSDVGVGSRPVSVHQDFMYPTSGIDGWASKPCHDETLDYSELPADMGIGHAYTSDEAIPILDLRSRRSGYYHGAPGGSGGDDPTGAFDGQFAHDPRRMSGSSFTVSTSGALSDMAQYDDFCGTMSDVHSLASDYHPPPTSNRNSLMSSTQLSPVASPRMTAQNRSELVRAQSRGRASPSPRPGVRTAPYSVESVRAGNKRWSTGSYAATPTRRHAFVYPPSAAVMAGRDGFGYGYPLSHMYQVPPLPQSHQQHQHSQQQHQHHHHHHHNHSHPHHGNPSPSSPWGGDADPTPHSPFFVPFQRNSMLLPSQLPSHQAQLFPDVATPTTIPFDPHPPPLMSNSSLFQLLQSNADPHGLPPGRCYADLSDPPDLYGSLLEEQMPPPAEDMAPADPELVPHEQELRFDGDLYTPRWVRGHGNKREGWCGICKPGRWLVLKNSAFWYDKSFTHGISAATGQPFQEPQDRRRMDGNPDVWEGLCGSCGDWIALVSSKKKGTTWFRHAYKCHAHTKVKDAPKRRRESNHSRAVAAVVATTGLSQPARLMAAGAPAAAAAAEQLPPTTPTTPMTPPQLGAAAASGFAGLPYEVPRSHPHAPPPVTHSEAAARMVAEMDGMAGMI